MIAIKIRAGEMFYTSSHVNLLSARSALFLITFLCMGIFLGGSGDVGSPEFNVSGGGFLLTVPWILLYRKTVNHS